MHRDVVLHEVACLASDLVANVNGYDAQSRELARMLPPMPRTPAYIVGCGDSLACAYAVRQAFRHLAGIEAIPLPAQAFLSDHADSSPERPGDATALVIAVSASGKTPTVLEAVARARGAAMTTIAITGDATSPLGHLAEHCLVGSIANTRHSPGIRTFQASVVALLLLAIAIGESQAHGRQAGSWRARLRDLSDFQARAIDGMDECLKPIVSRLAGTDPISFAGSGPSYGAARFAAAKTIEIAGRFAAGQDLEEWWHVERFAAPADSPVCVLAPRGPNLRRALTLVAQCSELGRRVALLTDTRPAVPPGIATLVVPGLVDEHSEWLTPLLFIAPTCALAYHLAASLGRHPFEFGTHSTASSRASS